MGAKNRDFVFEALEINDETRERAVRPDKGDIFGGGGGATGHGYDWGCGPTTVFNAEVVFGGSGMDLRSEVNGGLSRGTALLRG